VRHSRASRSDAAGFTLLEVLVALAIAGLVSLIAMQSIGLTIHGVTRVTDLAGRLDQRRGLELQLRRALDAAPAIPILDGAPGFIGHRNGFSFLSLVEQGGAGLYRLTLSFDVGRSDRPLVLTRELIGGGASQPSGRGVVARGVAAASFAYFGAPTPADKPTWQPDWEGRARPPALVRMILDTGDGAIFPPMIFRVGHAG